MRPFSFEEKPFHIARILFSSFHYHSFSYLLRALLYFDSPKKKRKKDRKRKKKTMERKIFSSYRLRSSLFYTNKPFFLFLSSSIYLYPSLSFSFILSFILSFFLFFFRRKLRPTEGSFVPLYTCPISTAKDSICIQGFFGITFMLLFVNDYSNSSRTNWIYISKKVRVIKYEGSFMLLNNEAY